MIPSATTTHNFVTKVKGAFDEDPNTIVALGCNCCNVKVSRRPKSAQYGSGLRTNNRKSFEDLENYFKNEIKPKANYQYVIIKTLLENYPECDRELINEEIKFYNSSKRLDLDAGLETLSRHGFLDFDDQAVVLKLNGEPTPEQKIQLVSMCNRYIYREHGPDRKELQSFTGVGTMENWVHSFRNFPTKWAITTENPNNPANADYNLVNVGDLLYCYPTDQANRGFTGVGIIKKKVEENEPWWPDEPDDHSKYAKRVIIDTLYVSISPDDLITVETGTGLPFVKAMNRIANVENAKKLFEDTNKKWKIFPEISKPTYYEFLIKEPEESWEEQKENQYVTLEIEMSEDLRSVTSDGLKEFLEKKFSDDAEKTVAFMEFSSVKKGDVIIAYDGSKILGIGRTAESFDDGYDFRAGKKFPHRLKVDWEPDFIEIPYVNDSWSKFKILHVEETSGGQILSGIAPQPEIDSYIMLEYDEKTQKIRKNRSENQEYYFKSTDNDQEKIKPNSNSIWFQYEDNELFLVGSGPIFDEIQEKPGSVGEKYATLSNFSLFDREYHEHNLSSPRRIQVPPPLFERIQKYHHPDGDGDTVEKRLNAGQNIIQISNRLFEQLVDLPPVPKVFEDEDLSLPDNLEEIRKTIQEKLLIDETTIDHLISSLVAKKHILLTGAIGTGKTHIATLLPSIVWDGSVDGYYAEVRTATSDWTTQDVIGGIMPKIDKEKQITYAVEKGCVSAAVYNNWLNGDNKTRVYIDKNNKRYRGMWTVIDEFNRANIDRSFGQLFTALEYGEIKLPTNNPDKEYEPLRIPKDYRIIGTLNTSDKHFLHTLSDALKRRFDIIELLPPPYEKMEQEKYHVVKKVIGDMGKLDLTTIAVDDDNQTVVVGSDVEAEAALDTLYRIMTYIRLVKPLGTALLISMFRFMITNHKLTDDWNKSLDLALTSTVLPQIESFPYWTLKVVKNAVCGNLYEFFNTDPDFKKSNKSYFDDITKLGLFFKITGKPARKTFARIKKQTLVSDDEDKLNVWKEGNESTKNLARPKLDLFSKSIENIVAEKSFSDEYETDDETDDEIDDDLV